MSPVISKCASVKGAITAQTGPPDLRLRGPWSALQRAAADGYSPGRIACRSDHSNICTTSNGPGHAPAALMAQAMRAIAIGLGSGEPLIMRGVPDTALSL